MKGEKGERKLLPAMLGRDELQFVSIPVYSEELPLKSNLHAPQISETWNEIMFFINLSQQYKLKQNIALQIPHMVGLFFPLKIYSFIFMCVCCLRVCMCTTCLPSAHRAQRKALSLPELDFQTVVSCHVDAGNWAQVGCQRGQCSSLLSPLSSHRSLSILKTGLGEMRKLSILISWHFEKLGSHPFSPGTQNLPGRFIPDSSRILEMRKFSVANL